MTYVAYYSLPIDYIDEFVRILHNINPIKFPISKNDEVIEVHNNIDDALSVNDQIDQVNQINQIDNETMNCCNRKCEDCICEIDYTSGLYRIITNAIVQQMQ